VAAAAAAAATAAAADRSNYLKLQQLLSRSNNNRDGSTRRRGRCIGLLFSARSADPKKNNERSAKREALANSRPRNHPLIKSVK